VIGELWRDASGFAFGHGHDLVKANGKKAGYVPRQYSETIAALLDKGVPLEATAIRQLGVPADVVRFARRR
jgi:hypothetical protein